MNRLAVILSVMLVGCYPAHRTIQPEVGVRVLSADGAPIQGAEVHLYSVSNPHGRLENHVVSWSNENGLARFGKIKDWKLDAPLLMHGVLVMHWNICAKTLSGDFAELRNLNKWEVGGKVNLVVDQSSAQNRESCEGFLMRR